MSLIEEHVDHNVILRLKSLAGRHSYLFKYCDRFSSEYHDQIVVENEGCLTDKAYVGPCSTSQRVWEIGLHEIGHIATGHAQDQLHRKHFSRDHRFPESTQIQFTIPVERAAWMWALRTARREGRSFSVSGYWYMIVRLWRYRICYGGPSYRYEKMNWFARRRVDFRAILSILGV